MAAVVRFEEQIEILLGIRTLADFRRWAASGDFPQRGPIDFLSGSLEVNMSSEVFGCCFRLDARRDKQGEWSFDLQEKP